MASHLPLPGSCAYWSAKVREKKAGDAVSLAQTVEHGGTASGSVFLLLCPRKKPAARMLA
jgi:hypothetical protein